MQTFGASPDVDAMSLRRKAFPSLQTSSPRLGPETSLAEPFDIDAQPRRRHVQAPMTSRPRLGPETLQGRAFDIDSQLRRRHAPEAPQSTRPRNGPETLEAEAIDIDAQPRKRRFTTAPAPASEGAVPWGPSPPLGRRRFFDDSFWAEQYAVLLGRPTLSPQEGPGKSRRECGLERGWQAPGAAPPLKPAPAEEPHKALLAAAPLGTRRVLSALLPAGSNLELSDGIAMRIAALTAAQKRLTVARKKAVMRKTPPTASDAAKSSAGGAPPWGSGRAVGPTLLQSMSASAQITKGNAGPSSKHLGIEDGAEDEKEAVVLAQEVEAEMEGR